HNQPRTPKFFASGSFRGCSTIELLTRTVLQQADCDLRILFRFKLALKDSRRLNVGHFSAGDEFQWLTEAACEMDFASLVLGETADLYFPWSRYNAGHNTHETI
ncbi:MAG: hypothetical protein C5B58_02535, partial [Acidobacteria bacterium]